MERPNDVIVAYKGFDKNLRCNGFQYEIGKEYFHEGEVEICKSGFHACMQPIEVMFYYEASKGSRYCRVELGRLGRKKDNDNSSRIVGGYIKIIEEIDIDGLVKAAIEINNTDAANASGNYGAANASGDYGTANASGDYGTANTSGDYGAANASGWGGAANASGRRGAANASGNYGAANASGDCGAANASGNYGAANASGELGIAVATGYKSKAKAALGCWIVLAERGEDYSVIAVKSAKVDGEAVKADTWYTLKNGKFAEVR